jgi:hypothetical protein
MANVFGKGRLGREEEDEDEEEIDDVRPPLTDSRERDIFPEEGRARGDDEVDAEVAEVAEVRGVVTEVFGVSVFQLSLSS